MRNIFIIILCIVLCFLFSGQTFAGEKMFTCTCRGSVIAELGKIDFYSNSCGGGYSGGTKGKISPGVTEEALKSYIDPHGVLELIQQGLIVHYSKTSGWECRRED